VETATEGVRACTGTFSVLVMSLSDRYLDRKNLCVNKMLFNVVYSQSNIICHFLCSVISQGKTFALDR